MSTNAFWEQPEIVERFASRQPDHRLVQRVNALARPSGVRMLDLGCAGGRNTEYLASCGVQVQATDASTAMVEATRTRMTPRWGRARAELQVRCAPMTELASLGWSPFDAVIALGVLHCAASRDEWEQALDAVRQSLVPGGWLLVANHTPAFDPEGTGLTPVPGEPHCYDGSASGRSFLLDAPVLDREFARHGFRPITPTQTVRIPLEKGRRETVNALYRRL